MSKTRPRQVAWFLLAGSTAGDCLVAAAGAGAGGAIYINDRGVESLVGTSMDPQTGALKDLLGTLKATPHCSLRTRKEAST